MNNPLSTLCASSGALALGLAALAWCGEAQAREPQTHGLALQSGHASAEWWHGNATRGMPLTFDEQAEARRMVDRHLKKQVNRALVDHLPDRILPRFSLDSGGPASDHDGLISRLRNGSLLNDLTFDRLSLGTTVVELQPYISGRANLAKAEAVSGLRLRWGLGLDQPSEGKALRAFVYTDWQGRAGFGRPLGSMHGIGGHDLDAGAGLSYGGWAMSLEMNVIDSGPYERAGAPRATGILGYAVRF